MAHLNADEQPQPEPGAIAPAEGPAQPDRADYGPLYEKLPADLVSALRDLKNRFKSESSTARRDEVKKIRQAREFWKGIQYIFWSEVDQKWKTPFEEDRADSQDTPRYEFVTNIYQAFGLSIISVLSQSVPTTKFFPQSTQQQEDVATAKAASDVERVIHRNNQIGKKLVDLAYYLWTDGKAGGYVRYVRDGQRFGSRTVPDLVEQEREVKPASFACPECGAETPADQALPPAVVGGDVMGACPDCLYPFTAADHRPAQIVSVPVQQGEHEVANGQEVIDVVGALELKTPAWANEQHEFPYLIWVTDQHKSKLRAAYQHAAGKIGSESGGGEYGGEDTYEREVRLGLHSGGVSSNRWGGAEYQDLIGFERVWLRPWSFYALEDQGRRDRLLELFPGGVYVAFAGDVYCEARPESMDDHWEVIQALPGDGQNRPAIGTSLISVQERYNTLSNLTMENIEYGIPPTYADSEVLDFDAVANQSAEPAAIYPVRSPGGMRSIRDAFFQPEASRLPAGVDRHAQELMGPIAQFLTGAFPALFGGTTQAHKTASGYAMQRDQAMGRLGLIYRQMKFFWTGLMVKSVECFRENRSEDVEIPVFGRGGEYEAQWIREADLRGSIFAYPETDDQFPTLWQQQRGILMELIGSQDPLMQQIMGHPENLETVKRLIGLGELVVPDEDSRNKQYKEIQRLLAEQPMEEMDPASGMETVLPSVPVDEFVDKHEIELQVCRDWLNSDEGQADLADNPEGWANVRAHAMAHQQIIFSQQLAAMAAAPPPEEGG